MAAPVIVRAEKLGKHYLRVHEKPMLLRDVVQFLGRARQRVDDLWALRGLDFEMHQGDCLGILGSNGSGKTTLLSLVAGTSFPSEGSVSTRGRISMLLGLGAGFNVDMTGEENIIVNAGLIGSTVAEARARMRRIVEFAELEDVIDTQIRFYSAGMVARLGFAISINVSPDILVVDEVLGVGDIKFQRKCAAEFERLKADGTTILVATQSPDTVRSFCNRGLWLSGGQMQKLGEAAEVAAAYAEAMSA